MRVSGEGAFRAEKGDMSRQHAGGRFDVFKERRGGRAAGEKWARAWAAGEAGEAMAASHRELHTWQRCHVLV